MQFHSPLRYPGGKGRLTQYVGDLIAANKLVGGHYAEPYSGGAAIALGLLYLEYASHIHLNDIDPAVYAFWHSVLHNGRALNQRVKETTPTIDEWHRQREVQKALNPDLLDLGFSTLFLNRTNRSGILTGGVIGGKGQTGEWKIDARYNAEDLCHRIEKASSFRSRISLTNLDASAFVQEVLPGVPARSLVYLDPPYYAKGHKLYQHHYKHGDHARIASLAASIKQSWIVSYDNVPQVKDLYAGFEQEEFGLNYSAGLRYVGTEVMVFGPGIVRPGVVTPSKAIAG